LYGLKGYYLKEAKERARNRAPEKKKYSKKTAGIYDPRENTQQTENNRRHTFTKGRKTPSWINGNTSQ